MQFDQTLDCTEARPKYLEIRVTIPIPITNESIESSKWSDFLLNDLEANAETPPSGISIATATCVCCGTSITVEGTPSPPWSTPNTVSFVPKLAGSYNGTLQEVTYCVPLLTPCYSMQSTAHGHQPEPGPGEEVNAAWL
jgi:hypothetical protein